MQLAVRTQCATACSLRADIPGFLWNSSFPHAPVFACLLAELISSLYLPHWGKEAGFFFFRGTVSDRSTLSSHLLTVKFLAFPHVCPFCFESETFLSAVPSHGATTKLGVLSADQSDLSFRAQRPSMFHCSCSQWGLLPLKPQLVRQLACQSRPTPFCSMLLFWGTLVRPVWLPIKQNSMQHLYWSQSFGSLLSITRIHIIKSAKAEKLPPHFTSAFSNPEPLPGWLYWRE